jgi:hypothetical protein
LEIIELLCYLLLMSLFSVVLATFWSVCDDWCCRFMIMINVWEQIFFLWQCRKKERDIKSNNCACERVRIFRRVLVERNTETIRSNGKRNKNVLLWKKNVDVKWERKRTFFLQQRDIKKYQQVIHHFLHRQAFTGCRIIDQVF